MRTQQTDEWLTEYSGEHLFHELKMFWWLARNLNDKDAYLHDALLESFISHLRNLICFFYRAGRGDDVVAEDFFDNPAKWMPSEPAMLNEAYVRAVKELSHLTAKRKSEGDPEKPWDVAALYSHIQEVARDFANRASTAKLHEKVRELLKSGDANMLFVLGQHSHSTNTVAHFVTFPEKIFDSGTS